MIYLLLLLLLFLFELTESTRLCRLQFVYLHYSLALNVVKCKYAVMHGLSIIIIIIWFDLIYTIQFVYPPLCTFRTYTALSRVYVGQRRSTTPHICFAFCWAILWHCDAFVHKAIWCCNNNWYWKWSVLSICALQLILDS